MQSGRNDSTVSNSPLVRRARVVVADPFPIVLLGVRKLIEDDPRLEVVGEVSTMADLLERVVADVPDVALVDWVLASEDLKTTALLLQPGLRATSLIFFTCSEDVGEKRAMIRMGARDVVSKRVSASDLQTAVWNAWNRGQPMEAPVAERLTMAIAPANAAEDPEQRIQQLTRRERQLIPLVCGGMRNKAIAEYLGIAESTVWHHLTAVFTKLQVDDRMGLAAFAYQQGLVLPAGRLGPMAQLRINEAS